MTLREGTPLEDHRERFGLWVKREDLSCSPPGPPFSKMRGVITHVRSKHEQGVCRFGALDTSHSQAGHAVAYACSLLEGAHCTVFYPVYRGHESDPPPRFQRRAEALGANLVPLRAGRSAILFHQAKKSIEAMGGYMMPNALKLPETVEETAAEVGLTLDACDEPLDGVPWIVPSSSGTIAAGVCLGLSYMTTLPRVIVHLGYSRPEGAVREYIQRMVSRPRGWTLPEMVVVDEGYAYKDVARGEGREHPTLWPCSPYYDLKAFRWWMRRGRQEYGTALLWNVG